MWNAAEHRVLRLPASIFLTTVLVERSSTESHRSDAISAPSRLKIRVRDSRGGNRRSSLQRGFSLDAALERLELSI